MSRTFRLFGALCISTATLAQTAPPPSPTPGSTTAPLVAATSDGVEGVKVPAASAGSGTLPANTDVMLRLDEEVNSKRVKTGHTFRLTVAQDVMVGNYIVIPRGTPATGEVGFRTGKGAFGKSAKMEIDIRSIQLNGRTIPMVGHFRQEGEGNTGATVGAAVAVGVFAVFVTGRSAIFAQGREFRASTREPVPVTFSN